jgi:hypothetical protein
VKVIESPSGSEEPTALKVSESPALTVPCGSTDIAAVGGSLPVSASRHPARAEQSRIAVSIGARALTRAISPV